MARVAVVNKYWSTAGGGETHLAWFGSALMDEHQVEFVGPYGTDYRPIKEKLGVDARGVNFKEFDFRDEMYLSFALAKYDAVINGTHHSKMVIRSGVGIRLVFFPNRVPRVSFPRRSRPCHFVIADLGAISGHFGRWIDGASHILVDAKGRPIDSIIMKIKRGGRVSGVILNGVPAPFSIGQEVIQIDLRGRETTQTHDIRLLLEGEAAYLDGVGASENNKIIVVPNGDPMNVHSSYKVLVANSRYTANYVKQFWGRNPLVIEPPVITINNGGLIQEKEPLIVSVGRFFVRGHNKKQEVLIEGFKRLNMTGWRMVLIGSVNDAPEDKEYLRYLRHLAEGFPIEFMHDIKRDQLEEILKRATFYWHATGYGEDLLKNPEAAEHFGISVVEAMSAACLVCAHMSGGVPEYISNGKNGALWKTIDQLVETTRALTLDKEQRVRMSRNAVLTSQKYSHVEFVRKTREMVYKTIEGGVISG